MSRKLVREEGAIENSEGEENKWEGAKWAAVDVTAQKGN